VSNPIFPAMWKVAIIRPVAKVGTPSGSSDFRSISIVSLSKAFEHILHDQVVAICCRIFSLILDVGIVPRLLWSK
jgi:hypothetical protein